MNISRKEFPNPAFKRNEWVNLNGEWDFAFDYENKYEKQGKEPNPVFDKKINVPFCYESKMSGIGIDTPCENLWYGRNFEISPEQMGRGAILLKFGAVDYRAKVWVNGMYVGEHEGGYTPFCFEISQLLFVGKNNVIIKAEDSYSREQPRGKQMWGRQPTLCWYTNTSGIWQSVWLEITGQKYITSAHITPEVDQNRCVIEVETQYNNPCIVKAEISKDGKSLAVLSASIQSKRATLVHEFEEPGIEGAMNFYWSPQHPNLYDVKLTLYYQDNLQDEVFTYFGMRKISYKNARIYLNGEPLYQRLVLDQGYWTDSLTTPPSEEAIKKDIELAKSMGFNGVRKHQKIEDPLFYYWADKIGLLVWGELPSAFAFTPTSMKALTRDMTEFVERDYNHPCIITWVPFNESWGLHRISGNEKQKDFAKMMYHYVKSLDNTRMVVTNDGWEQVNHTDISGIHDYWLNPANGSEKYDNEAVFKILDTSAQFKAVYAEGENYTGEPIILSEYGGIKMKGKEGWGYSEDSDNEKEYLERLNSITLVLRNNPNICGFCYTQITDVMQEVNGLLDADRNPKASIEKLRMIFG